MSSIAWIFGSSLMFFLLLKIAASRYDGLVSTRQGRHDGRCNTGEVWGSRWFKGLTFAELQPNLPSFKRLVCFKAAFQAPPWCLDKLSGSEWLVLQSVAVWPLKKMIKNVSYLFDPFCAPRLSLPWEYLSWHGRAEVTWWLRPETSRWTRPAWRCPFDQDRGPAVPLGAAPWIELVSKNMVGFLRWGSPKPINTIGFNTKMI